MVGNNSSVFVMPIASKPPCCDANTQRSAPRSRKKKFTKTMIMEVVYIFFWAAFISLQAKFFCIIDWSSPVMAMVTKIPETNCFMALVACPQFQSNMETYCEDATFSSISLAPQFIFLQI